MTEHVVVVGIGGLGREVLDVVDAVNEAAPGRYELIGALDDAPTTENLDRLAARGVRFLGRTIEWLDDTLWLDAASAPSYVVGIASPRARQTMDTRFTGWGLSPAVLVHPHATVGSQTTLGPGTVLCAGARVTTNVRLGRHTHLHVNSTVGHDSYLGDYTSVLPLGAVAGTCHLDDGSTVGSGATVLQGLSVGAGAIVGAGAVVTRDIGPGVTARGVPARSGATQLVDAYRVGA